MERQATPLLTPTYNTILIMSIQDVVRALNNADYLHAYDCLETLWVISPPCVENDCGKQWNTYHMKLARILNLRGIDAIHSLQIQTSQSKKYIAREIRPMLAEIKKSLHSGKYLENEYGAKPRIQRKGHLSVPT